MGGPIFVLGAGWRTGSTVIQRLLCSHPDIHIWGENHGLCTYLEQAYTALSSIQRVSSRGASQFRDHGAHGWIAMMNPPLDDCIQGMRAMCERYFGDGALRMGKRRWGFKEVRHGIGTVAFLRGLYPDSTVLFIVRHPAACLASARATGNSAEGLLSEVGGAEKFLLHWGRLAESFSYRQDDSRTLFIRYEDAVMDWDALFLRLAACVGVSANDFDRSVVKTWRRGWRESEPSLTPDDWRALKRAGIWGIARMYGYSLEAIS